MSIKTAIVARGAQYWTSAAGQRARRRSAESARKRAGTGHVVHFFHDPADPYSAMLILALPTLAARYAVRIEPHLVGAPDDGAAPERSLLADWSLRDAASVAVKSGLDLPITAEQPAPAAIAEAEAQFAAQIASSDWLDQAVAMTDAMWRGAALPGGPRADPAAARAEGNAARQAAGHYLGGVLSYGGENYWGLDRLHYLESRLVELGLRRPDAPDSFIYPPPSDLAEPTPGRAAAIPSDPPELHYYLSFRSPYTWLAAERVRALAEAHGARLQLRFVLPMMMRGLPVPPTKRRYITLDTAREARRLGIAFGKIADPVGRPVERGYSLLPWSRDQGRGIEYCIAFMRAVWSQGVDAGSDAGIQRIVKAAGLDWSAARAIVDNEDWRAEAEANRVELLDRGLWGVPSFRVNDVAVWGQDRLWVIDAALRAAAR